MFLDPDQIGLEEEEYVFQTKPRFIEYFSDVYMEPNNDAQFKCKIIGKPEPKVEWFCNYRKITSNDKFEVLKDDSDHYTLIVKNANSNDEGEYTCKASNCKGETSWSANLYFNESLSKKIPIGKSALVAPNFLRKIKDSTVPESSSARFDCYIDGEPFPSIKWFKNNTPLDIENNPDKYALDVDDETGKVSFTILNSLKSKDEDEYTIKIENEAGISQCSGFLTVEVLEDNKNKRKVIELLKSLW